jgi:hypothetical protein
LTARWQNLDLESAWVLLLLLVLVLLLLLIYSDSGCGIAYTRLLMQCRIIPTLTRQ